MKEKISIFLKGFLMGICDVIPGVSGGTIAFITGIYSRLINAIKSVSFSTISGLIKPIFKRDEKSRSSFKESFKKLDLLFLTILFIGIASAIFIGSGVMEFLLENYFTYTIVLFIGLILASSRIIYQNIHNHNIKNISFGFIGFFIGILLSIVIPLDINPNLPYIFLGGFLAISAMFLPGISGAFILLIMGLYKFMLKIIHDISNNLTYFLVFILGAIIGALSISRLSSFLFRKDKCKTLYVLLGLIIGSLSIPLKKVYYSGFSWNFLNTAAVLIIFSIGFFTVNIIEKKTR